MSTRRKKGISSRYWVEMNELRIVQLSLFVALSKIFIHKVNHPNTMLEQDVIISC